jgi:hypothetical protein
MSVAPDDSSTEAATNRRQIQGAAAFFKRYIACILKFITGITLQQSGAEGEHYWSNGMSECRMRGSLLPNAPKEIE